jgi:tetratricopeptide (TPR) repeat protein
VANAEETAGRNPLRRFLDDNPGTRGEELIDVVPRDSIDRVLAFVHNPDSGVAVSALRVSELVGGVAMERSVADLAGRAGAEARGSYLVLVTQDCDGRQAPPRMQPGSWLFLRQNRLAAWDVVSYGPDCRPLEERVEASDHDAMRVVGEALFRRQGRGRFRYGALRYDDWDEAFVAPTREATLSLLRARAAASPADASVQNHLAVALYAAGDREAAAQRLARASALDPSAPDPHRNLAIVHRQRGDRAAAAREEALAGAASAPAVGAEPRPSP